MNLPSPLWGGSALSERRGGGQEADEMKRRRTSSVEPRTWAMRDRSVVPVNKTRARAMRSTPTDAERKLWWHLRYRLALRDTHFRRQVQLGRYIVDFASHTLKIVIELDGGQHATQIKRDAMRTKFLESEGYRVLRFWNNEVFGNLDGVLEVIHSAILATPTPGSPSRKRDDMTPAPPHKGEGNARAT
jgi:very-short-patch-repair endonuclease